MTNSLQEVSSEALSRHADHANCWIGLHGLVFDLTSFLNEHPGGPDVIVSVSGRDCTREFEDVGHTDSARRLAQKYLIGRIQGSHEDSPLRIPTNKEVQERNDSKSTTGTVGTIVILSAVLMGTISAFYAYMIRK